VREREDLRETSTTTLPTFACHPSKFAVAERECRRLPRLRIARIPALRSVWTDGSFQWRLIACGPRPAK